jgi:hypothetical protein
LIRIYHISCSDSNNWSLGRTPTETRTTNPGTTSLRMQPSQEGPSKVQVSLESDQGRNRAIMLRKKTLEWCLMQSSLNFLTEQKMEKSVFNVIPVTHK